MKENYFSKKMVKKTDAELQSIVSDKQTYVEEARQAAIWELENREIKSDAIENASKEIEDSKIKREEQKNEKIEFIKKDPNIVDDPNQPELHSKRVILMFSIIFSTIFGAVLLMYNMKETKNSKGRIQVLIFGVLYTAISIAIITRLNIILNLALIFNFVGAGVLTGYFWNKFIGKEFKFRKRSWIKPAIISVVIASLLVLATIYGY